MTLSPNANAAQDLPHHLVPLISTAPKVVSSLCKRSSTRRERYARGFSVPYEIIASFTSLKWAYSIFEENDTSFPRNIVIDFRDEENCAGGVLDGESVLFSLGV